MDIVIVNVLVSILSAVLMMAAIIYILTYVLGSFSSTSGAMSLKVVLYSLLYFFGSTIFLFMGVEWLSEVARMQTQPRSLSPFTLNIGASALGFTAVLHIFCGFVIAFLYLKESLTLKRALNNIRRRFRARK